MGLLFKRGVVYVGRFVVFFGVFWFVIVNVVVFYFFCIVR